MFAQCLVFIIDFKLRLFNKKLIIELNQNFITIFLKITLKLAYYQANYEFNMLKLVPTAQIADGCRMKVCKFVETEECGVCHSLYMKECHIEMEYSYKPIKEWKKLIKYWI